ncbi:MAG: hypothetical protein ABR592_09095 [Nitriliruptorales bacterium]
MSLASVPRPLTLPFRAPRIAARTVVLAVLFVFALSAAPAFAHEGHELECKQTCGLGNFCEEHPQHEVCNPDDATPNSGDLEGNEGSKVHDVEGSQRKARKKHKPEASAVREVPVGGVAAGGAYTEPPACRNVPAFIAVILAASASLGYGLYRLLVPRR